MNWQSLAPIVLAVLAVLAFAFALVIVVWARKEAAQVRARAEAESQAIVDKARQEFERAQNTEHRAAETLSTVEAEEALARTELERIAGLSAGQAREEVIAKVRTRAENEAGVEARHIEAAARREAQLVARRIILASVQRLAVETSSQASLTVVRLPSEEMKGRIIGKEGRNIRTFEALTGVNLIIDDTPATVSLSCFDPERREVAQVALERLIADGRIHPQRIEDAYMTALADAEERAVAAGQDAAGRAGVAGLHPELVRTLGLLRLRTSFGQNVMEHLVEAAQVAAAIAAEIGADVDIARRGALLHDIGKAVPADTPGTHAGLGAKMARRCGESPVVVNAIAAHHDEVEVVSLEGVIVQIADAISASRPGARRDEITQYIERMDRLEKLVADHAGVTKVLAMSSGREVRVVVEPDEVLDADVQGLANSIARHIEAELSYPGEIKVTVVRELRAEAVAG